MPGQHPPLWTRLLQMLFALACLAIAWHAFAYLFQGFNPRNGFHRSFAAAGWAVPGHFFAGGVALALAPLQLSTWLRRRWPALHRTAGWLYVLAVLIGSLCGLLLAPRAQGGAIPATSFTLLALLWPLFTGLALAAVLRGDIAAHRRWMLRSLALTVAAATLRLYLGLGTALLGLPFLTAYAAAAWLCWTVNLGLVEWWLRRGRDSGWASRPAGA